MLYSLIHSNHLSINASFCNHNIYVFFFFHCVKIFLRIATHSALVGGSCLSHLNVIAFFAAISIICRIYILFLLKVISGFIPRIAIRGFLTRSTSSALFTVIKIDFQKLSNNGHCQNICKWVAMFSPHPLQHMLV